MPPVRQRLDCSSPIFTRGNWSLPILVLIYAFGGRHC